MEMAELRPATEPAALMTGRQVCQALGVSSASLHYYERQAILQPVRLWGMTHPPRWYRSDVERLADQREAARRKRIAGVASA